jgi:putative chitobiose transport system substrate-binding protein
LPVTPALRAAYFESALQANTFNGQLVGLPWYLSTSVTFYNRELWKMAGLTPGHWPKTYQQLAIAAEAIKRKTPAYGFLPNFGDRGKFMEILAQEGIPLLSKDQRHAAFDTPQGINVLAFWRGLFQAGIVPQDAITQDHREAIDRFQAGQTAAFPAGPQFLNLIHQNAPKLYEQLAVGPQITGASGHIGIGVMNLVMLRSCPHQTLAFDLAKFITNGPNQLAFCKLVAILPSIKAAASDPYFKQGLMPGADLEARARAISASQLQRATLLVPPMPHQSDLAKSLDDALQRAALGTMSPADSLHEAAQEWNVLLAS